MFIEYSIIVVYEEIKNVVEVNCNDNKCMKNIIFNRKVILKKLKNLGCFFI